MMADVKRTNNKLKKRKAEEQDVNDDDKEEKEEISPRPAKKLKTKKTVSSVSSVSSVSQTQKRDAMTDGKSRFYVYILEHNDGDDEKNQKRRDFAYVGFTFENEDLKQKSKHGVAKRLAQHNGIISGGAPETSGHRPLRVIATLTGDPSWFHKRHARYLETSLQKLAPRGFVRELKWRQNPKSISQKYRKQYKDFPPPVPLPLFHLRHHAKASRQINLMMWFLHNYGIWPIKKERSTGSTTTPSRSRSRRRRRRSIHPVDPRSGHDHQIQIALHSDFWDVETIRSIETSCRYWSPHFVPLVVEPYIRTK